MFCAFCGCVIKDGANFCGDCGKSSTAAPGPERTRQNKSALTKVFIIAAIFIGALIVISILAAITIPSFLKYRDSAYESELKTASKNAYTAARSYLSVFPGETIDTESKLISGGYSTVSNVLWIDGSMEANSGNVVLRSNTSINGNTVIIEHNGRYTYE